jgi:hypothetical protein
MKSRTIHALRAASLCVALGLVSACETSRYYDSRYVDAPVETEVHSDTVAGSQVRALASVLGVARPDEKTGRPRQVEVRMRFENLGTVPAVLAVDRLSLVSADLVPFEKALVEPQGDLAIPAGETRELDAAFPVSPREPDWSGLNLRFTLTFNDVPVTVGVPFRRIVYPYYDAVSWHVGVGYAHCW